jgi:hypothetical protein
MQFKSAISQLLKTNGIIIDESFGDILFDLNVYVFDDKELILLLIDIDKEEYFYSREMDFLKFIKEKNSRIIFLFEKDWNHNRILLENRILSLWKIRNRIHGRACEIQKISKELSNSFLEDNHSLGSSAAFYRYGLFYKNEIKAVAGFSKPMIMTYEAIPYYSYVWERYASSSDCAVIGGMGKLLKTFIEETGAKHIMTYADKNWGNGDAFIKLGFKQVKEPDTLQSIIRDKNQKLGISSIGSLKFILDLR